MENDSCLRKRGLLCFSSHGTLYTVPKVPLDLGQVRPLVRSNSGLFGTRSSVGVYPISIQHRCTTSLPPSLSLPPALSDSSMTKRTRKFVDVHGAAARKISAIQVHREAGTRVSRARPIVPACGTRASSTEKYQSDSGRRSRK